MSLSKMKKHYYEIYGDNGIADKRYKGLEEIIKVGKKERSPELKKQDGLGKDWYLSEKMIGVMLYIDKFSK